MRDINCLRCARKMDYMGREKLQLGKTGWVLGDLPNLLAGALEVDICICPKCGKLEFFNADYEGETNRYRNEDIPSKLCPSCGLNIDFDCPKCPCCGYEF